MIKKIIFTFAFALLLLPSCTFAQGALGSSLLRESVEDVGLEEDLEVGVTQIISTILVLSGTIFLVLTIGAGLMWMTASGDEGKITKAKSILVGAVIGLAIMLLAYTITYFVGTKLGGSTSSSKQTCTQMGGICQSTSCNEYVAGSCVESAPHCCMN